MLKHKQKFKHDPENNIWGDCGRTAIACMLDIEVDDVPHFGAGGPSNEEFARQQNDWLQSEHCLRMITVVYASDGLTLDALLEHIEEQNPGLMFFLIGTSRNGVCHVVICSGGRIVHDPSPEDSGIVGPHDGFYLVEVLVPAFHFRPL